MKFPPLEVMIQYGIYTVKELNRFSKGLVSKKKINILSECQKCDFVYNGKICLNCCPWNTAPLRVTCPKGLLLLVIVYAVQKEN